MTSRAIVLLLITLPFLTFAQNKDGVKSEFAQLYWLNGSWSQTNISKPGKTLVEYWQKAGDFEMKGQATTTQNGDTVFVERITLLIKDNSIYYVADVPQNKESAYFKLTSLSSTGFVCENQQHDFPKKISYQLTGTQLKATISGNGKSIEYLYIKKD